MLSEKPWRVEALMRLFLGVIIFVMLGSLVTSVITFVTQARHPGPWLFGALAAGSAVCLVMALRFLRRRWNADSLTREFGLFLLCLYSGVALGMFALRFTKNPTDDYPAWRVIIGALSLQGSAILLTIPFAREHGLKWTDAFGFGNRWQRAVAWGVLATVIVTPSMLALQRLCIELLTRIGREAPPQIALQALESSHGWLDRLALGVVAIVLAPISEEIFFRGILYPAVKRLGYPRLALWGISLVFAAIHASLPIFLPLLVLALALTLLYEETDNLLAPITAHALFNALNFAMFFLGDYLDQRLLHHS